jgi:hypothetical protein
MHRNPVKRGLVAAPEEWKWSSFNAYACCEEYLVRVNCQEWPLTIGYSPARAAIRAMDPLIRKERMSGAPEHPSLVTRVW